MKNGTCTGRTGRVLLTTAALALAGCARNDGATARLDYNWDVRPILSNNCFRCHGPDAKAREADLRLDMRDSATAELADDPGTHAIVPGAPEKSELLKRVASENPDFRMPPPKTHLQLTAAEIATLKRWIEEGAEYSPHWAFIPPAAHPVPKSAFSKRAVNEIDEFVFATAAARGLTPSAEADRETLIQRATFTLTGLPATPEEVASFVADKDAKAYEKVVDRLLASPTYGERMASEWLDAARFADSDGYLDDSFERNLYPWRDWVIGAFNRNLPYNAFGTDQLAGDLLDHATKEQRLATAFGRLHRRNAENGIIDEEYRVEYVIDRTDTLGTAFLGLSVGCARCHDHKFDPISHVDYYSLGAFFNSTDDAGFYPQEKWNTGPTLLLTTDEQDQRIAELRNTVATRQRDFDGAMAQARGSATAAVSASAVTAALAAAEQAYYPFESAAEDAQRAKSYAGIAGLEPSQPLRFSPAGTRGLKGAVIQSPVFKAGVRGNALWFDANNKGFIEKADHVGWFDQHEPFSVDFRLYVARKYDEAAVMNHSDHLRFGSGGWAINLADNRVKIELVHAYPREEIAVVSRDALPEKAWSHLTFTYDGSGAARGITLYVDGKPVALDVLRDGLTKSMLPLNLSFAGLDAFNGIAFGKRWQMSPLEGGALDELRIYKRELTGLEAAVLHDGPQAVEHASADVIAKHAAALDANVRAAGDAYRTARGELVHLLTSLPEIMTFGDTPKPRQSYVLGRGQYDQHKEEVFPRGLAQIFPYDERWPRDRRGLAQWLFDPGNPLTARVYVNRLWQMHFGRGLVATAEDFGTQGAVPTHPYLLDWLARRFVESGWDVKALNKLMLMSATFRQSSDSSEEQLKADPENLYLARGVARRLTAEMIRDNALAVSGLLDRTIGGPSVFPYQPAGVWESVTHNERQRHYPDPKSVPNDQHRRSLYSLVRRGAPVPSMTVFDFPRRHTSQVRRPTSSTPLQALVLLNDPQYVEASRALAARVLAGNSNVDEQLTAVFRLAARRSPSDAELAALREFHSGELAAFAASSADVDRYLAVGIEPVPAGLDRARLAALTSAANVALNTPDSYLLR